MCNTDDSSHSIFLLFRVEFLKKETKLVKESNRYNQMFFSCPKTIVINLKVAFPIIDRVN